MRSQGQKRHDVPVHTYSAVLVPVPVSVLPRCSAKGEAANARDGSSSGCLVSPAEGDYIPRRHRGRYAETGAASATSSGSGSGTRRPGTEERPSPARMGGGIGDYTGCRCGRQLPVTYLVVCDNSFCLIPTMPIANVCWPR